MKYFCYVVGVDVIEIILYLAAGVNVYDIVLIAVLLLDHDNLILLFCCTGGSGGVAGVAGVVGVMFWIQFYVLDAFLGSWSCWSLWFILVKMELLK